MKKFLPIIILLLIFVPTFVFTVDEKEQAIITQVGEFKRAITKPGLHFKKPFIEKITRFEKRILSTDAPPGQYLTLDKKRLVVDFLARWKIVDPLVFFKSVRNLFSANTRIEDIVYSELREELATHNLNEVIAENRELIMDEVKEGSSEKLKEYGIELIDVRIKRADLPAEVQQSVFDRMVAERKRISKRYRSEGEEESAKIRAETNKNKEIILAEAYSKSEKIKGEGDKVATKIYSDSYSRDPGFYEFMRKLDAYDKIIDEKSVIFLPIDSNLLDLIRKID
ncbi:MAG: protease modulator HflC [Thermodesulfobacteriota bacterium]|nr:protease modulator HflC [Thermodesulfobacteriota bacterium]